MSSTPERPLPAPAADRARLRVLSAVWLTLVVLSLGVWLAVGDRAAVDRLAALPWLQAHRVSLRLLTDIGIYPFYGLFILALLYGWRRRQAAALAVAQGYIWAQLLGSFLVVRLLKMGFGRARPDTATGLGGADLWSGPSLDGSFHSFPSGHTADVMVGALFALLLFRRSWLALPWILLALAVTFTRMALAKHYPSDVLGGVVVAGLATLAAWRWWVRPRLQAGT